VAANSSGGVCGKMISPQSLSVATAAVGLVGKESDIFRFTLKHSILLTAIIGVLAYLQAYVITWIVPVYTKAVAAATPAANAVAATVPAPPAFPAEGVSYLAITAAAVLVVTIFARVTGKERAIA
jgi:lactate permease